MACQTEMFAPDHDDGRLWASQAARDAYAEASEDCAGAAGHAEQGLIMTSSVYQMRVSHMAHVDAASVHAALWAADRCGEWCGGWSVSEKYGLAIINCARKPASVQLLFPSQFDDPSNPIDKQKPLLRITGALLPHEALALGRTALRAFGCGPQAALGSFVVEMVNGHVALEGRPSMGEGGVQVNCRHGGAVWVAPDGGVWLSGFRGMRAMAAAFVDEVVPMLVKTRRGRRGRRSKRERS